MSLSILLTFAVMTGAAAGPAPQFAVGDIPLLANRAPQALPPLSLPEPSASFSPPSLTLPSLSTPALPLPSNPPSLLPSPPPSLPPPPPSLTSVLPPPPPLPTLANFTSNDDTTNVAAIVGGVVGGLLGLGVILALLLLWWYLKGRGTKGGKDRLDSAASSREDLSRHGARATAPYTLDQPDGGNLDAEKTAVNTPYGASTSQLEPQQQVYDSHDPYSLVPSPPPAAAHTGYDKPHGRYDQPRYSGIAEAY